MRLNKTFAITVALITTYTVAFAETADERRTRILVNAD